MNNSQLPGTQGSSARSRARRAELIAIGRGLFADVPYDALSMDEIAQQAGVAKGLIYYYFTSKRGYYLAVIEDAVDGLRQRAADSSGLPPETRVLRTLDVYLRYAQEHQAAFRTIATGGVGHDADVLAIRERARGELLNTIADGAWGRRDIPPIARSALVGWLSAVEGSTLDWLQRGDLDRDAVRDLLARLLRCALEAVEEFEPDWPSPPVAAGDIDS